MIPARQAACSAKRWKDFAGERLLDPQWREPEIGFPAAVESSDLSRLSDGLRIVRVPADKTMQGTAPDGIEIARDFISASGNK